MKKFIQSATRFLFFTGKGGVGKTSLACATSLALAESGKRVLLISTDPASNLDEVLGTELCNQPRTVRGVPGLEAMNIDPEAAALQYRERIVGPYRGVLPDAVVANIEEQLSGACTMEIASFNEFSNLIGKEETVAVYDHVVLDTAPTGHTLRLLNLPAAWNDFIAENKSGSSCLGPLAGLKEQKATYERAVATLNNADATMLVLVARADTASLKEAARASAELREVGMQRQQLMINAVYENAASTDAIAQRLHRETAAALASLPGSLTSLPQTRIPFRAEGSVGLDRLRKFYAEGAEISAPEKASALASEELPQLPDLLALARELSLAGKGVILTMGKGGVGKTTVAVQLARLLAEQGNPVLLTTTDPADHVSRALEQVPQNLRVEAIHPKTVTEQHIARVMSQLSPELDASARELLEEELRSPCIEEIAIFTAFAHAIAQGQEQFVVLDTAPTGHTLLLLDTTEAYHREVLRNSSTLSDEVKQLLPRLRDPLFTRVLLLTLAEATPVHEAAALQKDLRRAGIEPYAWIINRTFCATHTTDPQLLAKSRSEAQFVQEVIERHSRRTFLIPAYAESAALHLSAVAA